MNQTPLEDKDKELSGLLRQSRPEPALPLGFEAAVWRRMRSGEPSRAATDWAHWLEALAEWFLRPQRAMVGLATLAVAGLLWGTVDGLALAKQQAQARYLAAVAPDANR